MTAMEIITLIVALSGVVAGIQAYRKNDADAAKSYAEAAESVISDYNLLRIEVRNQDIEIKELKKKQADSDAKQKISDAKQEALKGEYHSVLAANAAQRKRILELEELEAENIELKKLLKRMKELEAENIDLKKLIDTQNLRIDELEKKAGTGPLKEAH